MTAGAPGGGAGAGSRSELTAFQLEVARLFFALPESKGFLLAGGAALPISVHHFDSSVASPCPTR